MPNANSHRPVHRLRVLHVIGLCGVLYGCSGCKPGFSNTESAYRRGLAENPTRAKIGMRTIEPSWVCFRSIDGQDEWLIDAKKDIAARKVVKHDARGSLLSETDSYLSGRVVIMDDNKFPEEIKLHCDYLSGRLRLIYLGDDKEITFGVDNAATNNAACLALIKRVTERWFGERME
jgi:hypothetical protein